MLCSLPRWRSVVEISYGCIGRSAKQERTARASGLPTRRRAMLTPLIRLLETEYSSSTEPVSTRNAGASPGVHRAFTGTGETAAVRRRQFVLATGQAANTALARHAGRYPSPE